MVSKHGQRANRKREEMGKTNNVLFSKFQLTYSCLNAQNGWFICIGHCEKKKLTFKISSNFGRSLQNVKIGDNLFTHSFPRTLSNKGVAP